MLQIHDNTFQAGLSLKHGIEMWSRKFGKNLPIFAVENPRTTKTYTDWIIEEWRLERSGIFFATVSISTPGSVQIR
jgi:hypothetical protein